MLACLLPVEGVMSRGSAISVGRQGLLLSPIADGCWDWLNCGGLLVILATAAADFACCRRQLPAVRFFDTRTWQCHAC